MIGAAITGHASITGYDVTIGSVGGNLRAAGSEVTVGTVGGYALITGAEVTLNGAIAGDVVLVADEIESSPGATVAGALTIYAEDPTEIVVPESVAPAAQVKNETPESYDNGEWSDRMPIKVPFWRIVKGFLSGVLISGLIAALVIAIAPQDGAKVSSV